jgi:hypothetical protein
MPTREELARAVLAMFAKQGEYFRTKSTHAFEAYKAAETAVKHDCQRVVEGETLFPGEDS